MRRAPRPAGTHALPWLAAAWLLAAPAAARGQSTAFYYGQDVPEALLQIHDRVVVEPDALRQAGVDPARLMDRRARLLAYVSVGELARGARPASFRDDWVRGHNPAWNSDVMDLTHPGWRRYVIEERMQALWQQGFRGFFLDTLDSYRLAGPAPGAPGRASGEDQDSAQVAALVSLIEQMHTRFPGVELVANRGFEILPRVATRLRGVVAESLFDRWNAAAQRYERVPEADRAWLLARLGEVRERHGLPITVIDYRPPAERARARQTARRIAALGFDPWVTDAALTMVGVGAPEIVPRHVLVLVDGAREALAHAVALRLLAPVLTHEGYVPVFRDVRQPLPREPLAGRYAGIATWFPGDLDQDARRYCRWLEAQLDAGMRVAVLGHWGFDPPPALRERLGLTQATRPASGAGPRALSVQTSGLVGFEAAPRPHRLLGPGLVAGSPDVRVHLRIADADGPVRDAVLTAPWGGLALAPYLFDEGRGGALAWVVDPFAFVREALALAPMPAPDVTTESGHRLLMLHVNPDGAAERAALRGTPRTGDVVRTLLTGQPFPHSTTDPALARDLAHVHLVREPVLTGPGSNPTHASPWLARVRGLAGPRADARMPWPTDQALDVLLPIADEDGYRSEDGGAAFGFRRVIETLERTDAFTGRLAGRAHEPTGGQHGAQGDAEDGNQDDHRPGAPARRLTPIALRYHAYTASTPAGLRALEQIYAWVRAQDTRPVLAGEYADMVHDFHRVTLARDLDGGSWHIHGLGSLRTLRLPRALGWPDLARSPAVVAVRDLPQGRYVTFAATAPHARLTVRAQPPDRPVIRGSNARVLRFQVTHTSDQETRIRLHARGHVPVSLVIDNLGQGRCVLRMPRRRVQGQPLPRADANGHAVRFDTGATDTGDATLSCITTAGRRAGGGRDHGAE